MKLNNKGFTLIELLGVIIILVTIILIAIPSITATMSRNKDKEIEAKQNLIIAEVKLYVEGNRNRTKNFLNGTCAYNTEILESSGIVSAENLVDSDENLIPGCVYYDLTKKTYLFAQTCPLSNCPL